MAASMRKRKVPVLRELFGSEPAFEMTGADRAVFHVGKIVAEASCDARGWLGVVAKLPLSESTLPVVPSLLELHRGFGHPAKFALEERARSVDLRVDVPQSSLDHLRALSGALKEWICEGVDLFDQIRDGKAHVDPGDGSERRSSPDADLATVERVGQQVEQALKDSCLEWSAEETPGTYSISLDLDEYFQKIQIEVNREQSLLIQSPMLGPSPLSGDALKAMADFLLRANHRIRFARLSLETDAAGGDEAPKTSKKSVVAEVAWPVAQISSLLIEKAVPALIVAARLTRLEAEVLFDPGVAQAYLGMSRKERPPWEAPL